MKWLTGFLLIMLLPLVVAAQVDSNYIRPYARANEVEAIPGMFFTSFDFRKGKDRLQDYKLKANGSAYLGGYVQYKWLSVKYAFNIPGTQLDNNTNVRLTSFRLRFGSRRMTFHPFYDAYNGLLIPENRRREFAEFRNIMVYHVGFDYFYYFNWQKLSFDAAHSFSERQLRSSSAPFVMITPVWQQVNWRNPSADLVTDSATYKLLSADPQWMSMVFRVGYAWNVAIDQGRWLIAPAIAIGGGGLHEIRGNRGLQPISDFQGWVNAGYNGDPWYFYVNGSYARRQSNLFVKSVVKQDTDFFLTLGFRFANRQRKIMGIL